MGKCDLVFDLGDDSKYCPVISKVLSCAFRVVPMISIKWNFNSGLQYDQEREKNWISKCLQVFPAFCVLLTLRRKQSHNNFHLQSLESSAASIHGAHCQRTCPCAPGHTMFLKGKQSVWICKENTQAGVMVELGGTGRIIKRRSGELKKPLNL